VMPGGTQKTAPCLSILECEALRLCIVTKICLE
jgi:hypothetical protein